MRRRQFIAAFGSAAIWPYLSWAQQVAKPVIGYLHSGSEEVFRPFIAEFLKGLRAAGFIDGQNVAVEYRWAHGALDKLPSLVAELIDSKVSLIVAGGGGLDAPLAAKAATSSIPIVFTVGSDPLQAGLVAALAHPGGNLTGVSILNADTQLKRDGVSLSLFRRCWRSRILWH